MKRAAFLVCAALLAVDSFAGNLPVLGAGASPTTITVFVPPTQTTTLGEDSRGASTAPGPTAGPTAARALQAFNSATPVTFTGSPADIQALADFAAGLPDGPLKDSILANLPQG